MDKNDTAAFDDFFAASFQRVVSQVYLMTGNLAEVEDAVQDAFARAWQRWDTYNDYQQPEAWVRLVAYRIMVSGWRKAANRLSAHRRAEAGGYAPDLSPDHVALVAALRAIPPDQRRAVVLHHLVGLSVDEVAAETSASPGTVKSRLSRGRKALAPLLADDARQPGFVSGRGPAIAASAPLISLTSPTPPTPEQNLGREESNHA